MPGGLPNTLEYRLPILFTLELKFMMPRCSALGREWAQSGLELKLQPGRERSLSIGSLRSYRLRFEADEVIISETIMAVTPGVHLVTFKLRNNSSLRYLMMCSE